MRPLPLALLLPLLAAANLFAGRLDVAVIQFPEAKDPGALNAAFSRVNLSEISNSDRTRTKEPLLKGGYVAFAQSLPLSPGARFSASTRIRNERADIEGSLGAGRASVSIEIVEGVKAGLRSFQNRIYRGSGAYAPGVATVLSLRVLEGKAPRVIKGSTEMKNYHFTTVVAMQYTP